MIIPKVDFNQQTHSIHWIIEVHNHHIKIIYYWRDLQVWLNIQISFQIIWEPQILKVSMECLKVPRKKYKLILNNTAKDCQLIWEQISLRRQRNLTGCISFVVLVKLSKKEKDTDIAV